MEEQRFLTVEDVEQMIKEIDLNSDEEAHSAEDDIHRSVLKAIAAGAPNAKNLAETALKTLELKFYRFYA